MTRTLVGISAWSDRSLVDSGFYPATVKTPADRLRYYSERFDVAEIDSSYHFFPTRRNLDLWLGNAAPEFVFDIKAFSLFTGHPTPFASLPKGFREQFGESIKPRGNVYRHHLSAEAIDDLWRGFSQTLQTLGSSGKLGAVLFQFPPWFLPSEESFVYLEECGRRLSQYRVAIEFRAAAWMTDDRRQDTVRFLRQHGLTLVCVDEPQGFKSSVPPVAEVTAPLAFIRFHGRNAETWERKGIAPDERFKYLYNEDELRDWLPKVGHMQQEADELHIIFKNKYQDYPVRNAVQFRDMLGAASSGSAARAP